MIMKLTGAEILIECLKEQGVDTIFGFPGGSVLNIYDALYKYRDEIRHILTSHEQGASHAADGYARATGRIGVCLATSGPGATNLVTGIATAYMDSIPMVAITGQVPTSLLGKDSFQEVDIIGITLPITKHNFIVKDVKQLAKTVRAAFKIAREGRQGPVLIDICKDVTAAVTEYKYVPASKIDEVPVAATEEDMLKAAEVINQCSRPIILAGGGVIPADASAELVEFATKINTPVTTTLMGLGVFPGSHPLFTGLVGMHGTKTTNLAVSASDLFIAVGARFSDRVISNVKKFAPDAKIIHIDIDPAEVGKNINVQYPLIGNLKKILKALTDKVNPKENIEWIKQIDEWKQNYPLIYTDDHILRPQFIMEKICELTNGQAIITTEVGQHQIWAAQFYKYNEPRAFISSGGLGTMGFGLGASMGAQIGRPDKKVFNIAGDGSFRMNCNELATAVEYKLPIVIVIMNNRVLGMVRQWQSLFYDERYSQTCLDRCTDFVKLAEAYGAAGVNVTRPEEVEDAIKSALIANGPVVINCEIDKDEKVYPIVPPGAPINELIDVDR